MSSKGTFVVHFEECDHSGIFPEPKPIVGDKVLCLRCRDYRTVKEMKGEWRWYCEQCRTSRRYGAAAMEARRKFETHSEKYPRHRVRLYEGNHVREEHTPESGEALFAWVRDNGSAHQQALRNLKNGS